MGHLGNVMSKYRNFVGLNLNKCIINELSLCTDVSMLSHSEDDAMSGNKKTPGAEDEVMCLLIGLEMPCTCI